MTPKPEQESLSGRSNAKPEELRECAYCKADESQIDSVRRYNEAQDKYFHYVDCNSCEMSGPTKDTEQEAIAAWNSLPRPACDWRTHMTPKPEQERELIEDLIKRAEGAKDILSKIGHEVIYPSEAIRIMSVIDALVTHICSRADDWVRCRERNPDIDGIYETTCDHSSYDKKNPYRVHHQKYFAKSRTWAEGSRTIAWRECTVTPYTPPAVDESDGGE